VEVDRPSPGEELNVSGEPTAPRQAATVIVLRGGDEVLELLLVRRTPKARFMGGVWVFPGGAVDAAEGTGDRSHRIAAVRGLDALADPAGLCYGEPIREAGRTLVPVSRVRVDAGGSVEAVPVAILDVSPAGARFAPLRRGREGVVPALVAALAGAAAGGAVAALGRRRRVALRRRPWR